MAALNRAREDREEFLNVVLRHVISWGAVVVLREAASCDRALDSCRSVQYVFAEVVHMSVHVVKVALDQVNDQEEREDHHKRSLDSLDEVADP